jgi:hypothetical protein
VQLAELPRLPNGKPDYAAMTEAPDVVRDAPSVEAVPESTGTSTVELRALYADLLGRDDVTEDSTFVGLGGDSLSYVEMSVRLEDVLGQLPAQWPTTPIRDLSPAARPRHGRAVDTSVLLRALAIVTIVGSHANLFMVMGGAHVLLAVAGFNFARFQLSAPTRADRTRHVLASLARVAVPSMVWIAGVGVVIGTYGLANVLFLNGVFGSNTWTAQWQFWFLEALVWTLVAAVALLAVPAVDRAERRAPFGFALAVLAAGLVARYALVGVEAGFTERYTPLFVFWFFALGWAIARATTARQRLLLTAVTLAAVPGYLGEPRREALIVGGVCLLIWTATVRVPRLLGRVLGVLASSSLYVYLTHWQIYPYLEDRVPVLAVLSSFALGIAYWLVARRGVSALGQLGPVLLDRVSARRRRW